MNDGDKIDNCPPDIMEGGTNTGQDLKINHKAQKFPFCIVWTPIPLLSWLFPFIGHMGIATAAGVIRDFAGPYYVGTGQMAFGKPTKYWQLKPAKARGGSEGWDRAVFEASEEYKGRNHNLCFDNCHSHVAMALNLMSYNGSRSWNMVKLALLISINGKYVSVWGFIKTWLPLLILVLTAILATYFLQDSHIGVSRH